jgi:hypothetical protein
MEKQTRSGEEVEGKGETKREREEDTGRNRLTRR